MFIGQTDRPICKAIFYSSKSASFEAKYVIDGYISKCNWHYYLSSSKEKTLTWLQLEFKTFKIISKIKLVNQHHQNKVQKRRQLHIYVGNNTEVKGQPSKNRKCGVYRDARFYRRLGELSCSKPLLGRFLTLQRDTGNLAINEIYVFGSQPQYDKETTISIALETGDPKETTKVSKTTMTPQRISDDFTDNNKEEETTRPCSALDEHLDFKHLNSDGNAISPFEPGGTLR